MRSEYVFAASKKIGNRFLLCKVASASARRLQVGSTQPSELINKSLKLIAVSNLTETGTVNGEQAHYDDDGLLTVARTPKRGHEATVEPQLETIPAS